MTVHTEELMRVHYVQVGDTTSIMICLNCTICDTNHIKPNTYEVAE